MAPPSPITTELQKAVETAYEVFNGDRPADSLAVCHCNVCMDRETEGLLIATPLREIPSSLLSEYTNSAHGWDDSLVARDMRYFLPRYLELIAVDDPPDTYGLAICLRRLGGADWRRKWRPVEVDALDQFFDALLHAQLTRIETSQWQGGYALVNDLEDLLSLIISAGGSLDRALAVWSSRDDLEAAIHMAALRLKLTNENGATRLKTTFRDTNEAAMKQVGEFLTDPMVEARLERAFFQIQEPLLQQIISDALNYRV